MILFITLLLTGLFQPLQEPDQMTGAWQTTTAEGNLGMLIVTDNHFSMTFFKSNPAEFIGTRGGKWTRLDDGQVEITWEFNTLDKEMVGTTSTYAAEIEDNELAGSDYTWIRLDNGGPGKLSGAWLITGREHVRR